GRALPLFRFALDLLSAGARELVVFRFPVVVGNAPFGLDVALLLELHERGIDGAVIQYKMMLAGLLDTTRNTVAVLWAECFERLENHQCKSTLPDVSLLIHVATPIGFLY